jgi:hypothetical protein
MNQDNQNNYYHLHRNDSRLWKDALSFKWHPGIRIAMFEHDGKIRGFRFSDPRHAIHFSRWMSAHNLSLCPKDGHPDPYEHWLHHNAELAESGAFNKIRCRMIRRISEIEFDDSSCESDDSDEESYCITEFIH